MEVAAGGGVVEVEEWLMTHLPRRAWLGSCSKGLLHVLHYRLASKSKTREITEHEEEEHRHR